MIEFAWAKLKEWWAAAYGNRTVYRVIWTTVQATAGVVAADLSNNPTFGAIVMVATVVASSLARERLAARPVEVEDDFE